MKHFILFSFLFVLSSSFACDCKSIPNPLNEKVLTQGSHEFFLAEITKMEEKKEGKIKFVEYSVKVIKKYNLKNYVETLTFRTRTGKCQSEFTVGEQYLISTTQDKEKNRWTDQCHFKREFKNAKRYLDFLDTKYKS